MRGQPPLQRSLEEAAAQVSRDVAAALAEGSYSEASFRDTPLAPRGWPRGELGAHPDAPEALSYGRR